MSIDSLRQKYPEYDDLSDLQLAEAFYKKNYSDVDKNEYYKLMFPNIAQVKIARGENLNFADDNQFMSPDDQFQYDSYFQNINYKPSVAEIAEKYGVGVNEGASQKARFAASLGFDEKNKALAIKNVLSDLYKQDIDVRVGNNTGELEFLNPKTEKYELVNKPGVDLGDFTGMGGEAMVILPDIAATIAATVYSGGNLPVGITAGALTAGIAEYGRYKLGQKLYGINEDVTDEQLLNRALIAAGVSAGSAVLGVGAAKVIKGFANLAKGRFIKGDEIADAKIERDIIKADEVAENINKQLDSAKIDSNLKFTLAQAGNDADMLAAQAGFENINKLGYMQDFKTFNVNQAKSLNDYFGFLKKKFNTTDGRAGSEFEAGTLIQKVFSQRNQPILKKLQQEQEAAETVLEKAILELPDGTFRETGVAVRGVIDDIASAYKKDVDAAAKLLDEAGETEVINTNLIKDAIKKLTDKEKANLIRVNKIEDLFKDKKLFPKKPSKDDLQLSIFKDITSEANTIPVNTVRNTLSSLKTLIRNQSKGSATGETPEVGSLKFIQKTLEAQLRADAPQIYLDQFDNFNKLVTQNKLRLNNEIISKLTLRKNGSLVFGDNDVFKQSFKSGLKSKQYAENTYDVIKDTPDAMLSYKNSINELYKQKVIKNDKVNLAAHEKFLKDYKEPLEVFLTKPEINKISKIGGFQELVDNTTKLRETTKAQLAQSFEGKLESMTPGNLVTFIYKPNKIGEINKLKNILKKDPEVFKAFQRSVLTDFNESVTKFDSNLGMNIIDPRAFSKYLYGGGERGYIRALEEIFDNEFVSNLRLLNTALQITARKAPARGEGFYGSAFSDIIRARLGQFTLAGRLFTAGRRIYKSSAERIMANALLDPQSLKDLIRLRKLKSSSKEAIAILSKLGGTIFIKEDLKDSKPMDYLKKLIGNEEEVVANE